MDNGINNIQREEFFKEFSRITILDILRIINKRKISIIITFSLSLILTIIYTYLQEPLYLSKSYVDVGKTFDFIEEQKYSFIIKPEHIKSRTMLERIAKALQEKKEYSLPPNIQDRIEFLNNVITASFTASNNQIEIRAVTNNPNLSADIANKTADIFAKYVLEDQQSSSIRIQKYLSEKIPKLREQINLLKLEIEKIDNIASLNISKKEFKIKLEDLKKTIIDLTEKKNNYNSKIRYVARKQYIELKELSDDEINRKITEFENKYADFIDKGFRDEYIDVQDVLKNIVYYYSLKIMNLSKRVAEIEENIKTIDHQLEEANKYLDSKVAELEDKELYKRKIQSELKNLEEQLSYNIQKFEQVVSEIQGKTPYVKFSKEAKPPITPEFPDWSVNIYAGIALGLIFSIIYVLIIENFDPTLDDIKKIKRITNYPILGYILYSPEIAKIKREEVRFLISKIDVKSLLAESFRVLKINLNFALEHINQNKVKLVSITSTNKGEGKTTVLINLAITYAQSGKKVLIIDCNLRRPTLYKHFSQPIKPGIIQYYENYENNQIKFSEILRETDIPNLFIMPSGGIAKYPVEVLESDKLRKLIQNCKEMFDIIFFDCPPLGLVIDAAVVGKYVDGILVVYSMLNIPKENLLMVLEQLEYGGVKILGLVLNSLKKATQVGYFRHYKYYKYSFDEKKNKKIKIPQTLKV